MRTRIVAVATSLLMVGGVLALATGVGETATVAAPTSAGYMRCVQKKNKNAGTVTNVPRKFVDNNSNEAHAICGVYLVTGL